MSSDIMARSLRKEFRNTTALASIDLDVPEGSIYALIGPNGAGKTTLIKTLMNIHRPTSGQSTVLGIDSRHLSGKQFDQIGYVSENQDCIHWMTVQQFFQYLAPFYPEWDSQFAQNMISRYQLPLDRKISQLSRGMTMKLKLVSALAYHPKLVVLDEPFTGLDAMVRDELIEGLLSLVEGSTIFISSHDLNEVDSFASHIGYLDKGTLQFSEDMDSLHARFREIVVTLHDSAALPVEHPPTWLQPEASGAVIRFVASQYQDQKTEEEVRHHISNIRDISINPLSLRSIFVVLAKTNRVRG